MKLNKIETEVVCIILEYVCYDSSAESVKALMLVNKYFYNIVKATSHRSHKIILYDTIQKSLDCQKSLQDTIVLRNLRHLKVEARGPWAENWEYPSSAPTTYGQFLEQFEPFNDYIRSVTHLKTLTWNAGPIPETLLSVLSESHPRASLKILDFARFQPHLEALDKSEIALSQCAALTHLRFSGEKNVLWNRDPGDDNASTLDAHWSWRGLGGQYDFGVFLAIISKAPKLEYAGFVAPWNDYSLLLDKSTPQKSSSSHTIQTLTLDGKLTINRDLLVDLKNSIDLRHVKTLKISRGTFHRDFFQCAQGFFTNLRHISMNFKALSYMDERSRDAFSASIKQFFLQCHPLQAISVWSWAENISLDDIISRHGQELKKLQLHERSDTFTINDDELTLRPARILTLSDLRAIRQQCPKLVDLTVDLRSEKLHTISDELRDKLEEIALFEPPLHVLRLYCNEISTNENTAAVQKFVKSIWEQIYSTRPIGERRLEMKFGEWDIRQWRNAESDGRCYYQVMPHDRDDMLGECKVKCRRKV